MHGIANVKCSLSLMFSHQTMSLLSAYVPRDLTLIVLDLVTLKMSGEVCRLWNWSLVFIAQIECVFFEVETEYLLAKYRLLRKK